MKLTEAKEADLETLVELWYSLAEDMEDYSELNELSYSTVSEVPDEGFGKHLESEDVTDFLLRESGKTVGFVTLRSGQHPSREYSKYLRIVNLFVKEAYRNNGYGTEAIGKVKEIAQENGCDHLKVSFEYHNEGARRFYSDQNFEEKQIESVYTLE